MNPELDFELLKTQARELANQRKPSHAYVKFQRCLQHQSRRKACLYLWLAIVTLKRKEATKALSRYKKALLIDPQLRPTYYYYADALYGQGKFQEAHTQLSQYMNLENDPSHKAFALMANICLKLCLYKEADDAFWKLAKINPKCLKLENGWRYANYFQGNLERAKECLLELMTVNSFNPEIPRMLGLFLLIEKKYQEAIDYFQKAIKIEPWEIMAWLGWSIALFLQRKEKEAMEKFHEGLKNAGTWGLERRKKDIKKALIWLNEDLEFQHKYLESGEDERKKVVFKASIKAFKKIISLLEECTPLEAGQAENGEDSFIKP